MRTPVGAPLGCLWVRHKTCPYGLNGGANHVANWTNADRVPDKVTVTTDGGSSA